MVSLTVSCSCSPAMYCGAVPLTTSPPFPHHFAQLPISLFLVILM
jgi:hypothetical protein